MRIWGASWGLFGGLRGSLLGLSESLGPLEGFVGVCWRYTVPALYVRRLLSLRLGSRGTPLGSLWEAVLKPLGGRFGASWGLSGAFWGLVGASLGPRGALFGPLGALSGRKARFLNFWSPSWASLGAVLGPFWAILWASWAILGPSSGHLGPS